VEAMGKENAEEYVKLKLQEWKEYEQHMPRNRNEVTAWEVQKYLYT
jgi:glutamine synthetase